MLLSREIIKEVRQARPDQAKKDKWVLILVYCLVLKRERNKLVFFIVKFRLISER
jgi:hypothetical protein